MIKKNVKLMRILMSVSLNLEVNFQNLQLECLAWNASIVVEDIKILEENILKVNIEENTNTLTRVLAEKIGV